MFVEREDSDERSSGQSEQNNNVPPQKLLAFVVNESGDVQFILQGINMDEAFVIATKGYVKLERAYKGSI